MAIYSCNLRSIGRTTHAAGTAGAHIRYISRPDAQPVLLAEHMPYTEHEARNWIDARERAMRKNGRVIDKLRIALPRELDEHGRAALVEALMADLTGGSRVPWFAAIHQHGKDAHNPHVHIAVHDRDLDTGRRVLRLSDNARDRLKAGLPGPKAVEWVRERWEAVCNEALAEAGIETRVDRRTLEAQKIDRKPGIHEGPRARVIEGQVRRPLSKERINGCGRVIDYPSIDVGRTRREFNAQIVDFNLEKAAGDAHPPAAAWAQYERAELAADRALEIKLADDERTRTAARRGASQQHLDAIARLRRDRELALRAAADRVRRVYVPRREALRARQGGDRAALKKKQGRIHIRLMRILDITGITRRRQEAARKLLSRRHKQERSHLTAAYRAARNSAAQTVRGRYAGLIRARQKERGADLARFEREHREAIRAGENARQQREIEREHAMQLTEAKIENWTRTRKGGGPLGVESGFAKAMKRAAEQEARRPSGRGKDGDFERER